LLSSKRARVVLGVVLVVIIVIGGYFVNSYYQTTITKAQRNKVLIVAADDGEPITLDPAVCYSTDCMRILRIAYDKLLNYKPGSVNGSELVPDLATSWNVSPDGKVYTFNLREGVKFTDGTDFNSSAVVYSFERLKTLGQGPSWFIVTPVQDVTAPNAYTVTFTLTDDYTDFLARIAAGWGFYIVSPTSFNTHSTANDTWSTKWAYDHVVGTGAYKLLEWQHHDHITLVKNGEYWGGWTGDHIEQVIVREVKETTTQRLLLEKGDADISYAMTITDLLALKSNPDIQPVIEPSFSALYIFMDCQRAPLNDTRVRQAISYAYDYNAAVQTILHGTGKQMQGPLPRSMWGWDPDASYYTTDLQKAKQLMTEAGYPNGVSRTLVYTYPTGDEPKKSAGEILKNSLASLGINVELKSLVWAEQAAEAQDPKTAPDFFSLYWWPDYADPIDYLYAMFHSSMQGKAGYNWAYYDNSKLDKILDTATLTPDVNKRMEMYKELQRILYEDAPSLYPFEYPYTMGMRTWVKGFVYNPLFIGTFDVYAMHKEIP
jgi:peptide/nickel transport system substrate-binding protein